jgi:ribosome-binding protein aMBF1 (putative translation factor)
LRVRAVSEALVLSAAKTTKHTLLAVNSGGYVIGEQHPRAVLTDHEVTLVFELREQGYSQRWLAAKFEVGRSTIRDILSGRTRAQTPDRWKAR